MIDYDREAASYDDTRGGPERAAAVASAVLSLLKPTPAPSLPPRLSSSALPLPPRLSSSAPSLSPRSSSSAPGGVAPTSGDTLLDVACGTGIVTALLSSGRSVLGVDRSAGMLSVAATRLRGRVLLGDATRLPLASGSVGTVLMVWLLHLLPASEPALEEAVRVLRPGGLVITTVDKNSAYFAAPSDLAEATAAWRIRPEATDRFDLVAGFLAGRGLKPAGESAFPGIGQGRSPRWWREVVRAGGVSWARSDPDGVDRALARLPDQDRARPEPVYRLAAFSAGSS
ncbi:MAG TPA: class I SAM-dependent methyltransferase [Actinoplanes sp.]